MSPKQEGFPSVWTRPRTGREQPALSREHIVAEALRLLDEEGIDALSMRKLGGRLSAGATSLYRHVANKDELLELAVDEVYGEIEVRAAPDPADWRTDAAACAHSLRATILRHPWLASVLGEMGMSHLGPNSMRVSEGMLKLLTGAGFPAGEADRAVTTLVAYVTGMATGEAAWLNVLARSGQDERTMVEQLWPAAEEAAQDHPLLREGYAQQRGTDPRAAREEGFRYGLDRVLDGLETRLR
ncbi:TetR/AcrR family transcriptional regulator [Streptomyces brasiliscabiei]|uniref:TetR/AcrR family transcriptional regulator n=3 Tax=Streptomyces TaxID=1883 RepID=A0ABU8GGU8_9ACTN|nr:TetR/AcrR family transcriptional regulator [Streptomyces griseiscabiei]MBZ3908209.1 TetR/AcrR family transcriptional regulator C-terminal domain-containing protein [Streptomyces griseiscabiei]MDX2914947.1 TetR/AcrR family transcriptional regulator [Streptomyces griseiscabiei]